jgi:hypothetical protein
MSPFFSILMIVGILLSGTVFITLSCEDNIAAGSYCENVSEMKAESMPHQSYWSQWWAMWEIG